MGTLVPGGEFRAAYAAHRAAEGRRLSASEFHALPYVTRGPLARQWGVRARSYDAFVRHVLGPALRAEAAESILDLGAGCGWLSRRCAEAGLDAVALDIRTDDVDGLGVEMQRAETGRPRFEKVAASFDATPFASGSFDIVIFNASIHYATDLAATLCEARRVARAGGRIVILDSPFYATERAGAAMVMEKRRTAEARFGASAGTLLAPGFIEFLTDDRLSTASQPLGLMWRRRRVSYPLWYELRPAIARLRGERAPSRFDLWECRTP